MLIETHCIYISKTLVDLLKYVFVLFKQRLMVTIWLIDWLQEVEK